MERGSCQDSVYIYTVSAGEQLTHKNYIELLYFSSTAFLGKTPHIEGVPKKIETWFHRLFLMAIKCSVVASREEVLKGQCI